MNMGQTPDWKKVLNPLAPAFSERAAAYDNNDEFVAENYAEMRGCSLYSCRKNSGAVAYPIAKPVPSFAPSPNAAAPRLLRFRCTNTRSPLHCGITAMASPVKRSCEPLPRAKRCW